MRLVAYVLFGLVAMLITGSVRQVLRWLTRVVSVLAMVPGVKVVWGFIQRVLRIAANYLDEAVLSYILVQEGQNVWRAAADGVVLYAQSWRRILRTALLVVLVVLAGWLSLSWLSFRCWAYLPSLPRRRVYGSCLAFLLC